jgi:nitrite reductase/ring-hydroxylating ferredoxin subunit
MPRRSKLSSMTKQYRPRKRASDTGGGKPNPATRRPPRIHYKVALASELGPGESRKFLLPIRGADEECFLINYQGRFHAYVNRCRHVPMAMDWVDNQFFAEQGRYLMCQTHNAYYEPDSGECVAGPPGTCGKALYRVPLEVIDGIIYAAPPEDKFEDG